MNSKTAQECVCGYLMLHHLHILCERRIEECVYVPSFLNEMNENRDSIKVEAYSHQIIFFFFFRNVGASTCDEKFDDIFTVGI
jgi:hypothetical protein